jgi:Holliday junction resolvase RusA-like endonuclease
VDWPPRIEIRLRGVGFSRRAAVRERRIAFVVPGRAQPAGSKRAFPFRKKDGRLGVAVSDANPKARGWKERVALVASEAMNGSAPWTGPLVLKVSIHFLRPKTHMKKSGEVRGSAPSLPATRPDITKLLRACEDALTGVVWKDDAQIVQQVATKTYSPVESVAIIVVELEPNDRSAQEAEEAPPP